MPMKMIEDHHEYGCKGYKSWGSRHVHVREGNFQSPIDIETKNTIFEKNLLQKPLSIIYDSKTCNRILNNGYTFQVDCNPEITSIVKGGPLKNDYNFLQFHMHWGDILESGSEHLVDGRPFAAELHFVNWNRNLYDTPISAMESNQNDGLAILAVFVKIGKLNEEFDKISQLMHDIRLKNQQVHIENFDLTKLLPKNQTDYWTYPGSLTSPPCCESAQWIIFKETIELTAEQIEKCRTLHQVSKESLCNKYTSIAYNDRQICRINNRNVLRSFE